jgi:hypothetical protein
VARAKRTQRADARRRYRQTVAIEPELDELDAPVTASPSPAASTARRPAPSSGPPMGFTDSMRAAWHRPDVRADIAALPSLLVGRWFLIPVGLVLGATLAVALVPGNVVSAFLFQTLVYPPAMAPVFVVGFFAKRASYLLGLIVALIDVAAFAVFVYFILPSTSTEAVDTALQQQFLVSAITIGPLSGIFFAAGAAWYRRFLAFSGAQRMRQRQGQQRPGQRSGQQRSKASKPARG